LLVKSSQKNVDPEKGTPSAESSHGDIVGGKVSVEEGDVDEIVVEGEIVGDNVGVREGLVVGSEVGVETGDVVCPHEPNVAVSEELNSPPVATSLSFRVTVYSP